jgi:hypothetical protein
MTAHARIPVARYAALYRLINDSLDDEGFALFSRPLRRGSFEFLCRAVLSAPTLGLALERIARYLHVVLDDLAVEIEKAAVPPSWSSAKSRRCRSAPPGGCLPTNGCCA